MNAISSILIIPLMTPCLFINCLARNYLSQSKHYHYLPLVLGNYKVATEVNESNTTGLVAGPFSVTDSKSYSYKSNVFSFSNVSYFPAGL